MTGGGSAGEDEQRRREEAAAPVLGELAGKQSWKAADLERQARFLAVIEGECTFSRNPAERCLPTLC